MIQQTSTREFEALINYVKRSRGFDFTGYKRPSLIRRFQRRMQTVDIGTYNEYMDYLEVHPDEFIELFNTILINVTSFYRDRDAWDYLRDDVIPKILANRSGSEPIRVWSAGCASGEEAYSVAMLLAEALGADQFKERVKIYATDIDEEDLAKARYAVYSMKSVQDVPSDLLSKYFERGDGGYSFRKDLRRAIIFGRHDLMQDAPISRIDLLICRNTLMYFNAEAQARIMARFYFALNESGFLFLGKAEVLLTASHSFLPVDLKRRVFTKASRGGLRDQLLTLAQSGRDDMATSLANHVRIREAAFEADPLAQIVVDAGRVLLLANERARGMFGISIRDVSRSLHDMDISYKPVELR
jgi:two-component system CheB/CheR fusion protein